MSDISGAADPTPPVGGALGKSYKTLAIWSLICAIWVLGPVGIILGVLARKNMRTSNNFDGQNIALAGVIVGAIMTVLDVIVLGPALVSVVLGKKQALADLVALTTPACVPLYFALQIWFGYAWSGRWRVAALVPLVPLAPILIYTLAGLFHGSNLWPLFLIFFTPLGLGYLLVVCAARAIVNSRAPA